MARESSTHFITGATGFVGSHLVHRFLQQGDHVVAMVRGTSNSDARQRLLTVLAEIDNGTALPVAKLKVFAGDVTESAASIVEKLRCVSHDPVHTIWHSAVTFKFRQSDLPEIRAINIEGSRNVVHTNLLINNTGPRPRYMHVSTAYSSGRLQGKVPESIVPSTPDYRGLYEWSKHEIELDVERFHARHGGDVTVLRPAIIVGCENTGSVTHSGYYQVIGTIYKIFAMHKDRYGEAFNNDISMRFEADPAMRLNLVPIDYVIDSMVVLSRKSVLWNEDLKVFNLVNENAPVLQDIVAVAEHSLGITGLTIVESSDFERQPMNAVEKVFARAISFQAPYIKEDVVFETSRFRSLVGEDEVPVPVVDAEEMLRLNREYFALIEPELAKSLPV